MEVVVVVLIIATMTVYSMTGTRSEAELQALGRTAGAWIACVGGLVAAFLLTRWAIRPVASARMAPALVVAGTAVAIHALMVAAQMSQGEPFQIAYVIADALKVAGAVAATRRARP